MRVKISFLVVLLTQISTQAQEVLKHTLLFESGKHSISGNNDRLILLFEDIDIVVDSIRLIGYTDSIGRIDKNKKLADKRIRSVANFIQPYLNSNTHIITLNRGERNITNDYRDRRVDVVVYFKKQVFKLTQNLKIDLDTGSLICFKLAKSIIDRSKQDSIVIDNKIYMRLSTPFVPNLEENLYYSNDTGASANSVEKLVWVKYKRKESSFFRYYALIPLQSYKRFKVFNLEPGPCNKCHINSPEYHPSSSIIAVDYLKGSIEYKKTPFTRDKLKIRIPKHLVSNANALMYSGQAIEWLKKSDDAYLYAKVRGEHNYDRIELGRFYIKSEHCDTYRHKRINLGSNVPFCGGVRGMYESTHLNVEVLGGYNLQNKWGGHVALKIDILKRLPYRFKANFLAGPYIDKKFPVYSAFRLAYELHNRQIYEWGRQLGWSNKPIKKRGEMAILLGTEIKTRSTLMPGYGFTYLSLTYRMERFYSTELFFRAGTSYFNQDQSQSRFIPALLWGFNFVFID